MKSTRLIDDKRYGYGVRDLPKRDRRKLEQTVFSIIYYHHDLGITTEELEIILQLLILQWIRPGGPGYEVTLTDLAEHLEIPERRITYHLGRLKAKGYIATTITETRSPSESCNAGSLSLTDKTHKHYSLTPLHETIGRLESSHDG